ncbi:efflux RND transporter periplasmic adaptor subunit [Usitatibacter palustris]|uniref:Multidrug efflux pump subunit AcrA n=1 Tax=Usitatibacter palustris TaxID=2732487 RepID=A0A6M4HAH6_9PROT|nr:efflux RND transporter periplasmic adaptor subunit [Usitatibacter palustris]QJR15848.1 Multidrug efflux pump subunit AcrA [Usitatibacter palustris]
MSNESLPPGRTSAVAIVAVAVVLALLLSACGKGGDQHGGGFPPALVSVQEVKTRTVPVEFEYPAQTAGSREVEVRARVTGILLKRNYTEGERVSAGQSLFQLDAAPYEAAFARAEADVAAAEARLGQAQRQAKRYKPLYEAKAASQKDFDDAVSGEEVAAADAKAARARLNEAKLNLSWTRVESPVSGLTSRALKSEGSLVSGPDVLLTTVTQADPMYVNFGLSQSEQARIKADIEAGKLVMPAGGKFDVAVKSDDGKVYARTGKLVFTDSRVSQTTGTADARAELPNPDGALRPGQFVRVVLKGATRPNAVVVPQRAVMESPQGKMVYLLGPENKALPQPVTVGEWAGDDWVITSGLKGGEKIITDGLMKVFPGGPVQVGDPNAPPPGAPGKAPAKPDAKAEPAKPEAKK